MTKTIRRRRRGRRNRGTRKGGHRKKYHRRGKDYWIIDLQTALSGLKKIADHDLGLAREHVKKATKHLHKKSPAIAYHAKLLLNDTIHGTRYLDKALAGKKIARSTKKYAKKVDKFRVRQLVKPGITGLAQIRGYRGEIEKHQDIVNRVRLDIFYIENWSFILDLKIIIKTTLNAIRGEEKAY